MKKSIKEITIPALFAAVIAVFSQVSIQMPSGVPITLQTFAVALCGYSLSIRRSVSSVGVYILLGLCGVPVFSSFGGGVAVLFGKTGGFIFGFLGLAAICSMSELVKTKWLKPIFGVLGLIICHAVGVLQFSLLTKSGFFASALLISLPYLIKDIVFTVAAYFLGNRIKKVIDKM